MLGMTMMLTAQTQGVIYSASGSTYQGDAAYSIGACGSNPNVMSNFNQANGFAASAFGVYNPTTNIYFNGNVNAPTNSSCSSY